MTTRIATFDYDSTRALFDGSVPLDEVAAAAGGEPVRLTGGATLIDVFQKLIEGAADIAEFGLTFLLRAREAGEDLVALPIFPNRVFRHACVFVNRHSGIRTPADLVGRTIGEFGTYGQDSGVWAKGALMDDYGFDPLANRWVIGGLERPAAPFGFTTHPHPEGLDCTEVRDASLSDLLEAGEIDALFTANVPQRVVDRTAKNTVRLFEDYEPIERDWYRRTGVYPMMHTVAARRSVLAAHPRLARAVYDAYLAAKNQGADRYLRRRLISQAGTMIPWADALVERNELDFPADAWAYGIAANRTAVETYLRYHHEQGLSSTRWTIEELFSTDLLDT